MGSRALIGINAEETGHVVKQEQKVALEIVHRSDSPFPREC